MAIPHTSTISMPLNINNITLRFCLITLYTSAQHSESRIHKLNAKKAFPFGNTFLFIVRHIKR
jgi:hypothetical protein